MLSDQFITELAIALQAQNHVLNNLQLAVSEIDSKLIDVEQKLSNVGETADQLRELESLMDELEASQAWIETEDFGDFDQDQILRLYENRQQSIFQELTKIGFKDWDSFVRQCQTYTLSQGVDPLAPYKALLTEADLKKLQTESYNAQYAWDELDYMFVGASGILASLTDYLLVKIPRTLTKGEYAGQIGSPLTKWLKTYNTTNQAGQTDWFSQLARELEERCKVPYDSCSYAGVDERIPGMSSRSHRFQSLGHDPVLGFVFGVLDIMRGTITGFSYDKLSKTHSWVCVDNPKYQPVNLIDAIIKQIGHLISDVATPMGLPAPFMTLIQGINIGSFGEKERTVGQLARWMYLEGYDFRHFLVSGITPAVIEIILRAYIMLRHYSEYGETKFALASHPKYRTMLLMAHGIATLGNAGKIALMQGNPLAINYAEWMAFIRYLIPSVKYWVFDQHQLRVEHLERVNSTEWDQLLQSSDRLLATVTKIDSAKLILGAVRN